MKQSVNYRLDENTLTTITVMAEELRTTKTDIIENAVKEFASSRAHNKNALLQFAGVLSGDDAESMLDAIHIDKNSKNIKFDL